MGETPRWKRVLAGIGVLLVAGMAGPGVATARAATIPPAQMTQLLNAITLVGNAVGGLHDKVDYVQLQLGAIQQKVNDESRKILLPRINAGVTAIGTANTRLVALDTAVKAVQQKVNDESRDIQLPAIASAGAVAGSAEAQASQARTAAVGARTEAGAARTQASQARTAAVGARTEAGAARTQASQARTAAAAAATAAATAASEAAAARSEAAAGRVAAELGSSYALDGWWAAVEASNTADEIQTLAEQQAQLDANFRSATSSALQTLADAVVNQGDLIQSEAAGVRADMVTITNASRQAGLAQVEALLDAMQDEFSLAVQDLHHAIDAAMSAGADMSPMIDAWASTECAAVRDTPWWMLTISPGAEGVWQAEDSWCSIGRGDLRELGERMRDSSQEMQMFLSAQFYDEEAEREAAEIRRDAVIGQQVDRVRDALRERMAEQSQELREKLETVSDSNDDLLEEIRDNTARAADAAEAAVPGDPGDFDGTIPGAGDDAGFGGAVTAGQEKLDEWLQPFECMADVMSAPPSQSLCGAGPVLSIPIPGGQPFEWRPFSWCGDPSWIYMARDIAGWSLVVLACYGWINNILRAFSYGMASQNHASVAANMHAHQTFLPGEHRGVKL